MKFRHLGLIVALVLFVGCASGSTQLVYQPDETMPPADPSLVRMYVFRIPGSLTPGAELHIEVSGKHVGWIQAGDYLVLDMPAGLHNIRMELKRNLEKNLIGTDYGDLVAGKTYYGEIDFPITEGRRPKITGLTEREGKARIAGMTPASPK